MTEHASDPVRETARLWAIRVNDPAFADWDALTGWLDADPGHLDAYEAALDDDAWAAELFATPPSPTEYAPAPAPAARQRRWMFTGAAAAAVLTALIAWPVLQRDLPEQVIVTAMGERRTIMLPDGSRVVMNGDTRIVLDEDAPRRIELVSGEALFDVRHDARRPFVVQAGDTRLVDAGTVFNVVEDEGALDVAVSEGAVIYEARSREIRLDAGQGLSRAGADAEPRLRRAAPESVGSWQAGQLLYDDASLDQVARDLGRNLGSPVRATPSAQAMRFSGTLTISGSPEQVLERAGPLLGVRFTRQEDVWVMAPSGEAGH